MAIKEPHGNTRNLSRADETGREQHPPWTSPWEAALASVRLGVLSTPVLVGRVLSRQFAGRHCRPGDLQRHRGVHCGAALPTEAQKPHARTPGREVMDSTASVPTHGCPPQLRGRTDPSVGGEGTEVSRRRSDKGTIQDRVRTGSLSGRTASPRTGVWTGSAWAPGQGGQPPRVHLLCVPTTSPPSTSGLGLTRALEASPCRWGPPCSEGSERPPRGAGEVGESLQVGFQVLPVCPRAGSHSCSVERAGVKEALSLGLAASSCVLGGEGGRTFPVKPNFPATEDGCSLPANERHPVSMAFSQRPSARRPSAPLSGVHHPHPDTTADRLGLC